MALEDIDIGEFDNDPSADTLRVGGGKINRNFKRVDDNIDIFKSVGLYSGSLLQSADIQKINNLNQYTISEKESYWFKAYKQTPKKPGQPAKLYYTLYKMARKGKGVYGQGGTQLEPADLQSFGNSIILPDDIMTMPGAVINDLGMLPDGDYLTVANQSNWDFTDDEQTYFFSYTTDDVLYFVQFIGENGIYNGNFVADDFVATTNSNTQASPPLNQSLQSIEVTIQADDNILQDDRLIGMRVRFTTTTGTIRTPDMFLFDPTEGVLKDYPVLTGEIHSINFIQP